MKESDRMYFCIDMKCFFASVECSLRGLNPWTTPLVVADTSRGKGALCLAISPYLKQQGVKNRCRLYEIPDSISYFTVKPRMKKYIEYAVLIHRIFLQYVSGEDIHTYSIDEAFLDVTNYRTIYGNVMHMGLAILKDIEDQLGIIASCGAGDNLFLAKIALDRKAKKSKNQFYYLSKELFYQEIWPMTELTELWQIGQGISRRLRNLGIQSVKDIAYTNPAILQKEFGVIGLDLYEHAWGNDETTIQDIKAYEPLSKSYSRSQILLRDYTKEEAWIPLLEMLYLLCLDLYQQQLQCRKMSLTIGYSTDGYFHHSFDLPYDTSNYFEIKKSLLKEYQKVNSLCIRRIGLSCSQLSYHSREPKTLFGEPDLQYKKLYDSILTIWNKYHKNQLVIGTSLLEESTLYQRNKQIGGHNSD